MNVNTKLYFLIQEMESKERQRHSLPITIKINATMVKFSKTSDIMVVSAIIFPSKDL